MTTTGGNEAKVFGERYRIESKIARGGMADVFLARDLLLDRPVALKVLFPELSVDPSFVERFRREAQNAAKLSHPNIVSVYDWGEDGRTYYIVMEYVDGRSLSSILREDGPLTPADAAAVGSDVASALGFAHQNGVIHRDVKPGNVLVDRRGGVKVTDFGIARARNTTENLTQTGAVMGTATYFSPEQAQGLTVDERSDVYSLGVVLYELVAGKPPFQGDNPVTIAYKHVREQPTPLRAVNSTIPPAFEAVVSEAMAKSPANRYATANDLRSDLERFRHGQPVRATAIAPPMDATSAIPYRSPEQAYAESVRTIPAVRQLPPPPLPRLPKDSKGIGGPLLIFVSLLAIIGIAAFVLLTNNSLTGKTLKPVVVPNFVGQKVADAEAAATTRNLRFTLLHENSDTVAKDIITKQDPANGVTLHEKDTVRLTVSDGPAPVNLTDYTGQTADQATKALQKLGFTVQRTQATSDSVDQDKVISQDPASGTPLAKGQTVTLTISTGPQKVEVPSVVGYTEQTAAQLLSDAGLRTDAVNEDSDQPAGNVLSTDPAAGSQVPKGSAVTITVSNGRATTTTSTTDPFETTTSTTNRGRNNSN